jgi:oligoribonuclease (3'-5' exoribonuclease)
MNKKTKIEKVMSNEILTKNLLINELVRVNNELLAIQKTEFSTSLQLASFVSKSIEYFNTNECKEELKKLNIKFENANEFIANLINREVRQIQRYKQLNKIDSDTLKEFTESNEPQSIQNCIKFASEKKNGKINLSVTKPIIDSSKTIKPKKFEAKNKGISILINEVIESEARIKDIEESIKYLKTLLPKKETKKVTKKVEEVLAA